MILAFYGKELAESDLRDILRTKWSGTSPANAVYLSELGYFPTFLHSSFNELKRFLDQSTPVIVFLWTNCLSYWSASYMHSVVVIGMSEDIVVVNDPYFKDHPQQIPIAEFQRAWAAADNFLIRLQRWKDVPQ